MEPEQPTDQPEEQHVQETAAGELADEERLADVQDDPADPDPELETPVEGLAPNTSGDVGGAGGSTTADPGRQNPIIPGEGRL